jgi:hypothetical protein
VNKIKALLEKSGCKPELVDRIVESLASYKNTTREEYRSEYANKLEQAKRICIEETESHKRELARRLQVFCETKSAAIEAQLAKKSALNETEAVSKLKNIRSLLEGIQPNGTHNSQVTAALRKAKRQLQVATEGRQKAVEMANRKIAMAEKIIKRNSSLVMENSRLKEKVQNLVTESRISRSTGSRRIDGGRSRQQRPITTRPTLLENQTRKSPPRNTPKISNRGDFSVADIAGSMDEDLV